MQVDSCVLVIFGASGDLTRRKLIPAMYEMFCAGLLPREACVLGTARRAKSDDDWRGELEPWVREHAAHFDEDAWHSIADPSRAVPADARRYGLGRGPDRGRSRIICAPRTPPPRPPKDKKAS